MKVRESWNNDVFGVTCQPFLQTSFPFDVKRTALIFGVSGQDGAYLARHLLHQDYRVHGTSRGPQTALLSGLGALGIQDRVAIESLSPLDGRAVADTVERVAPDEIYNLSGQSSVGLSFAQPAETIQSNVMSTLHILEGMRTVAPKARFYNAGSSEVFGDTGGRAANEATIFSPRSPYAVAKAASISLVRNYRESYGLFACSGLLFNHESPLRPQRFVTRKITSAVARISQGSPERLHLGDLSSRRDWGWAPEYVRVMSLMLQRDEAEDFVVASGRAHSLQEFVATAFAEVNMDWRDHVDFDPSLQRPTDISCSLGDPSRAAERLGWHACIEFKEIVARMVQGESKGAGAVS